MVLGRYWWWWMHPLISVIVHIYFELLTHGKPLDAVARREACRQGMNIVQLPSQLHRHVDGTCHVPFYKDYVTMSMDIMGFGWWLRPQLSLMLQYSSVDGDKHCHLLFVYSL